MAASAPQKHKAIILSRVFFSRRRIRILVLNKIKIVVIIKVIAIIHCKSSVVLERKNATKKLTIWLEIEIIKIVRKEIKGDFFRATKHKIAIISSNRNIVRRLKIKSVVVICIIIDVRMKIKSFKRIKRLNSL